MSIKEKRMYKTDDYIPREIKNGFSCGFCACPAAVSYSVFDSVSVDGTDCPQDCVPD